MAVDAFKVNIISFYPDAFVKMSTTPDIMGGASEKAGIVPDAAVSPCVIKVVGVGGAGGNAVMRMIQTGVDGVGFSAINTDAQALAKFKGIATTLNIGKEVTRGLGAGGIPDNGRKAAEESRSDIMNLVQGCDLVFVTAGKHYCHHND